jgi:hypothetical protein
MRRASAFAILLAACGGPSAPASDPIVVVPKQPPQPPATEAPPPSAPVAAAKPKAKKPWTCRGAHAGNDTMCFHAEAVSWSDADRRCTEDGGRLLTIGDDARDAIVRGALGSPLDAAAGRAVWIGLEQSRVGKKREWRWATGELLKDASWSEGEPNDWDGHEQCAEMLLATGRWNDTRCNLVQRFVCEGTPCDRNEGRRIGGDTMIRCLENDEKDFAAAKKSCAAHGGKLATPRTSESQQALRGALGMRSAAPKIWIGLSDPSGERDWRWPTGAPLDYAAWAPGEPNDFLSNERCVELYTDTWQWNDLDCSAARPYVCEAE